MEDLLVTTLKARVVSSTEFEVNDDPDCFYIGPERTDYKLEGINCTVSEFLDWFLVTKEGSHFCKTSTGISDIGGSSLDLKGESILTVSYNLYLDSRIDQLVNSAKGYIDMLTERSLLNLGLGDSENNLLI